VTVARSAAAGLIAVVLAGCGAASIPTASPAATATSPASPSAAAACTRADVSASGGPWGGAAGSRGADVTVMKRGTGSCLLPPRPVVAVVDASGTVVLQTKPVVASTEPTLAQGGVETFTILFGNWCSGAAKVPLRPVIVLESGAVEVIGLALKTTDALPPCNGPGQPPLLTSSNWAAR
jgi:Protein of unknown function (DUF4232)